MDTLKKFVEEKVLPKAEGFRTITAHDLDSLKSQGYSVELMLTHLAEEYCCLFHGSNADLTDGYLVSNERGEIFASDFPLFATAFAFFPRGEKPPKNGTLNISCSAYDHSLEVWAGGSYPQRIKDRGFVYIIKNKVGFENIPTGSVQYIKKGAAPFIAKVEVRRPDDFSYPIFDMVDNRRIQ